MFQICVGLIGSFFDSLRLLCVIILKGSCGVGKAIFHAAFYVYDIIGNTLSAIHIIGEEFYQFICGLENDTDEIIGRVYNSTNYGFNWCIDVILVFLKHINSFLCNTKLQSKLLATKTGCFFNQSYLTIRNSLILIGECVWESIIFLPKLMINYVVEIGDCIVLIIKAIRITLLTIITDALFFAVLALISASLISLWLHKAMVKFYIKRIFVKCCYKVGTFIYNCFNRSTSSLSSSSSTTAITSRTWSYLKSSLTPPSSQLINEDGLNRTYSQQQCVICQDRLKCMVLLPCKHLCVCEECTDKMLMENQQNCPLCRTIIEQYLFVYI